MSEERTGMSESPDTQAEAVSGPCEACGCEIGTDGNCVWCAGDYPPHTHDAATPSAEPDGDSEALGAYLADTYSHPISRDQWNDIAETVGDWLAQRDKDRDAAVERALLDRLGEQAGQYHDVLDREIANSLRQDREYVVAHDAAVRAEAAEQIAQRIEAIKVGTKGPQSVRNLCVKIARAAAPAGDERG